MGKIKFNVKGIDSKTSANLPKPGLHTCKVVSCVAAQPSGKDQRLEVCYEITAGESKGAKMYDYINLESEAARWKLKQFLEAMGVGKDSGQFDPEDFVGTALTVKVKIQPETDQYPASARPQLLMPLDGESSDDDEEDLSEDEESDEDDDDESEEDEDEDEDEDEAEEGGDDEDYTAEDLAELDEDDLTEVAEEFEVAVPKKFTAAAKKKLIAAIIEAQDGDDEDEDEDEDEDDEDELDYSAMELPELKKLCKERELPTKGTKSILVKRLEKSDQPF